MKYVYYRNTQDRCEFEREGDLMEQMDDDTVQIDFAEFSENVDYAEIATQLGYGEDLTLEEDWHVTYSKSKYGGVDCYILGHSVSDFIFLRPKDQKMILGSLRGRNDQTEMEWKRRTQFGASGIDPR